MEGTPMAEVSESPFLRGDVPRINPESEQNSNERENQNTLQQIETNPARGRADDRVEFSEEARRQDALSSGIEDLAPNETEAEAFATPNAPIPEEQNIRDERDPNSLGNAPGANQARNFPIEERTPQDAEVSGDLSGRQELGSGVELREDSEVNPLGNQNNPIENRDNTGPVGERIESQNQRAERQEVSEPSDQDVRTEQQRLEQQQEFNEQGGQAAQNQNTVESRIEGNTENQAPEPREGISQTAAREAERSQIRENPRQNADLDTAQQPATQETTQTNNQTGQTEEVRPAQQEEIDSQTNDQQQDRQDISRQEDRNQDPVSAQTQVGRNVDELV
jgi:hypothetical protein